MNRKMNDVKTLMLTLRIPARDVRAIERGAKARNMTRSQFVRYALALALVKMGEAKL